jgi:hypothetical protein
VFPLTANYYRKILAEVLINNTGTVTGTGTGDVSRDSGSGNGLPVKPLIDIIAQYTFVPPQGKVPNVQQ